MSTSPKILAFEPELPLTLVPQGSLKETPAYLHLLWARAQSYSGDLVFERDKRIKRLQFKEGHLQFIFSNVLSEGLDQVLLRHGLLSPHFVETLTAELPKNTQAHEWDAHLIERIQAQQLLPESSLEQALLFQRHERLFNVLGWMSGDYRYDAATSVPFNPLPPLYVSDVFERLERFLLEARPFYKPGSSETFESSTAALSTLGSFNLLNFLCRHQATGTLTLVKNERIKRFVFAKGALKSILSNDPNENLSRVLGRWKMLSPQNIRELESLSAQSSKGLRHILLEHNWLSPEKIDAAMDTLHVERFLEGLSWWSGEFSFDGTWSQNQVTQDITHTQVAFSAKPELPTAFQTLENLCQAPPLHTLCLTGLASQDQLMNYAKRICQYWNHLGFKALMISMQLEPLHQTSSIDFDNLEHRMLPLPNLKTTSRLFLPLNAKQQSQELSELKRIMPKLRTQYERLLFILPLKPEYDLYFELGHGVLALENDQTKPKELLEAYAPMMNTNRIEGFVLCL